MGQSMVCNRSFIICTNCVLFRSREERQEMCCRMENVGILFSATPNMGDMGNTTRMGREYKDGNGNTIRYNKFHHFLYYTLTLFKNDMVSITAVGKIFWALGSLIWGSSLMMAFRIKLLDINFADAPPTFKTTMYCLSCVFLAIGCAKGIISCIHSYQRYRTDRLKNDVYAKRNGLHKSNNNKKTNL